MSLNLARFRKPSRYIGNEINIVRKDAAINVALCFPDTYEIGMSHLGLKILYSIINSTPEAAAERVYAPWIDYEEYLRANKLHLTSLENKRPLGEFDIVGFTLQYELSYTNIINMLDLGGIPIRSENRTSTHPLVIAGGPCAVNPLPLAPFIDAFVIGDGEEVVGEIIKVVRSQKTKNSSQESVVSSQGKRGRDREGLLKALSQLEGVYVPSVHDKSKHKINRRVVEDLDSVPFPDKPLVPFTQIVHDRAVIEISRGCTRGCRFCQAGMIYRPLRERSLKKVLSLAESSINNTGYEEISFASLSTGDYSNLLPLISTFNKNCAGSHVSVSLPSLRVGSITSELLREIKSVRQTGFTIAPEAGSHRLRQVINKDFTDEEYEETLKRLFEEGWKKVKLYFMIGLPTETMEDINGLIDMAVKASAKGREIAGRRVDINVGISAFVPKPHTPFQWHGQVSIDDLKERQSYIRKAFRRKKINFRGQHAEHSLLEAVFSRGDNVSSLLLENAWKLGCRFDGWSEMFSFDRWLQAAEETGIDIYQYASRSFDHNEELPWEFIDTGIKKEFLLAEAKRALNAEISKDCRFNCYACGLGCGNSSQSIVDSRGERPFARPQYTVGVNGCSPVHSTQKTEEQFKIVVPTRMRVMFSKTGEMRYLSHHELMTAVFRAVKRAKIPVAYSTGFHPHPKISFGPALPAGVEGLREYFDIEIKALIEPGDFMQRLGSKLPGGLDILEAGFISTNEKSVNDSVSCYDYEISIDSDAETAIHFFMTKDKWIVSRDEREIDVRPMVEKADIRGNVLQLSLRDTPEANVRLYEILGEMTGKSDDEVRSSDIKRTRFYGYNIIKATVQEGSC